MAIHHFFSCQAGCAFFQKGAQAFLTFRAGAQACDGLFGGLAQVGAEIAIAHFQQQVLAGLECLRAVEQQVVDPLLQRGVQLTGRVGFCEQAQFAGTCAVEAFGGQRVAAGGALADGLDHVRADHRWRQADADFGQAEQCVAGADGHVAAGDQPQRAAKGRALYHGQGRLRQLVKALHQLAEFVGVSQVRLVVEFG